ncbi:MAG: hypothetical protein HKN82_17945 [Akkermansiaceae bacterium]|nr:hypothetical protein [Akkermansiaceae bacterium]NNM28456.1 hypothetical protein [Akkermansiaceae bacterium]
MKTTTKLSWLAMAGVMAALAAPALAQDRPDRPRRDARPGAGEDERPRTLMAALDRNRDGSLDQNEIDMAVVVLRRMDRDQDGKVTSEEVASGPPPRPDGAGRPDGPGRPGGRPGGGRGPGLEMFKRIDTDGDGKISKDEAPDRMAENFAQIDGNADGFIDKEEQEKLIEMMRQRFRDGGGQRPGQRRRPDPGAGEGGTDKPKRPDPKPKDDPKPEDE